jgi:hypothetical protein
MKQKMVAASACSFGSVATSALRAIHLALMKAGGVCVLRMVK